MQTDSQPDALLPHAQDVSAGDPSRRGRCCAACGRPFPKPKPPAEPIDTSFMTDAQIHAHYKRISHIEDLKFHARTGDWVSSTELQADWLRAVIEAPTRPAAENRRRLARLLERWRTEALDRERPPVTEHRYMAGATPMTFDPWTLRAIRPIKAEEAPSAS